MPKRYGFRSVVLTLSVLLVCSTAVADSYTFNPIPGDGNVSGPPGSTVGWGYTITNDSTTYWLVTSGLGSDPFLDGTPSLIFDFPDLAPGATVTVNFDPSIPAGLLEFTWDAAAPFGFANSGNFDLSAQWWNGGPLNGGSFVMDAPDALASYSVSVTSTPEPPAYLLLLSSLIVLVMGNRHLTSSLRQWQA
jgi:hypothetical protein